MINRRPRVGLAVAGLYLLFVTAVLPNAFGAPPVQKDGQLLAVVNIDRIGHERLESIKNLASIDWWIELEAQLLVGGRGRLVNELAGFDVRVLDERYLPENLHILYGRDAEGAGARVLARGGRAAVIAATPAEREVLEHACAEETATAHGGHNTIVPFAPNVVLARQAANDPASGTAARFDVSVQALVDSIDANRWYADIQTLGGWNRHTPNAGNVSARNWLVSQFQAIPGLTVTTQQFPINSSTSQNVIATLPGTTRPDDWYIVGAHFDSTSQSTGTAAPGCEDNASGTAAVLEMARVFAANRPEATVIFICYSGEEQGLVGSTFHAQNLSAPDRLKVKSVMTMDMIGYTGDSDLDCLLETGSVGQALFTTYTNAATQYTNLRIVTSLNPFGSDHVPYINRSMPALLTIENDWDSYPNYHRTTDTAQNISLSMGHEIMKMNVATLAALAGTAPPPSGNDTAGIFNPTTSTFFLRNQNGPGSADVAFPFGGPGSGWKSIIGDWDGNGTDTIGLYDPVNSFFFLKNSNTPGAAELTFSFGSAGTAWVPVVGDWDGNGTDTIGLYNPATATFFLRNSNTAGAADLAFPYAAANMIPVVGDWNGDGVDTIGVFAQSTSTFFLRNSNTPGNADLAFVYGTAGSNWLPVAGDWNNDRADTIGLYQPNAGAFYLRNSNSSGNAATIFFYGPSAGVLPAPGDWDNQ